MRLSVRPNLLISRLLLTQLLCSVSMVSMLVLLNTLRVLLTPVPLEQSVARRVIVGTLHLPSTARVTCVAVAWLERALRLQAMETKLGPSFLSLLRALQTALIGVPCPGGKILRANTGERTSTLPYKFESFYLEGVWRPLSSAESGVYGSGGGD